jgi:hypothetical protein
MRRLNGQGGSEQGEDAFGLYYGRVAWKVENRRNNVFGTAFPAAFLHSTIPSSHVFPEDGSNIYIRNLDIHI